MIEQSDHDIIEQDLEEEKFDNEEEKDKERKKLLKRIERTKMSVINKPKAGKPVPSSKGIQDFIDKLCEENE
jgi:hypothetical protein